VDEAIEQRPWHGKAHTTLGRRIACGHHDPAAPVPDEPSARIAIATALGRVLNHSITKGMRYLERLQPELRVLAMRDATARDRAIAQTPEFVHFDVEHAEVLQ
jgi:hypothetical protein